MAMGVCTSCGAADVELNEEAKCPNCAGAAPAEGGDAGAPEGGDMGGGDAGSEGGDAPAA